VRSPVGRALLALGAIAVTGLAPMCPAGLASPAGATSFRGCSSLKGRSLLHSSVLKVVERGGEAGAVVYVCVRPHGRVRRAGSAYDSTVDSLYAIKVLAVAGTWLELEFHSQIDPQISEEIEEVFDAKTGRSYRFFQTAIPEGPALEGTGEDVAVPARSLLNRFGQLALALVDGKSTSIVGIEPSGARRVLDSGPESQIPPSSLTLQGHTVQWLDGGTMRSATL
jgi:hypothetical protein